MEVLDRVFRRNVSFHGAEAVEHGGVPVPAQLVDSLWERLDDIGEDGGMHLARGREVQRKLLRALTPGLTRARLRSTLAHDLDESREIAPRVNLLVGIMPALVEKYEPRERGQAVDVLLVEKHGSQVNQALDDIDLQPMLQKRADPVRVANRAAPAARGDVKKVSFGRVVPVLERVLRRDADHRVDDIGRHVATGPEDEVQVLRGHVAGAALASSRAPREIILQKVSRQLPAIESSRQRVLDAVEDYIDVMFGYVCAVFVEKLMSAVLRDIRANCIIVSLLPKHRRTSCFPPEKGVGCKRD
mmetsp:Transcript_13754/g.55630  ORF Transcript_13754/g.55630 Transcript_13754/m.55630 type:complete len:301 (+) Transcript_13754:2669-3571(+)